MNMRIAEGVGVEVLDGVVYAAPLPDGPIMVLEGVAALIWNEATEVPRERIAPHIAVQTGQAVESIRAHVDAFIEEVVARGLLRPD